jgi:hypothetical protein
MHRPLALLLPLALASLPAPAGAQAQAGLPPACNAAREGMAACFGEKLCRCRFEPGGTLTGRPAGHRWDCGALRPACGTAPAGPAPPELPGLSIMPMLQGSAATSGTEAAASRPNPRSGGAAARHETR